MPVAVNVSAMQFQQSQFAETVAHALRASGLPPAAVLMAATTVQMAIIYWLDKKLSTMHKATLALILIFGALTLTLDNGNTVYYANVLGVL